MTETRKEDYVSLERVLYIHYLLRSQKNTESIKALIDLSSKINAMAPAYASKLGFRACLNNVGA